MAKKVAKKHTPKQKRTEVTWANEDVTRRAIDGIHARLDTIEEILVKMTAWIKVLIRPTNPNFVN